MDAVSSLPQVTGEIVYLAKTAEKPHTYTYDPPGGVPKTNIVSEPHTVPIFDMRPVADGLSLDVQGSPWSRPRPPSPTSTTKPNCRTSITAEAENLVKQATGATAWWCSTTPSAAAPTASRTARPASPASRSRRVHGDYTEISGPQRVRDLMGSEADDLLSRRFAIINVWRPIRGPLFDAPLALCDATSLATGDLLPQDLIYRDRNGEIYGLTYNPAHRWYYAPAMQADEALLLKCFDSPDRRPGTFHAAHLVRRSERPRRHAAARKHRAANAGFLRRLNGLSWNQGASSQALARTELVLMGVFLHLDDFDRCWLGASRQPPKWS